jgi:hypothetical protein
MAGEPPNHSKRRQQKLEIGESELQGKHKSLEGELGGKVRSQEEWESKRSVMETGKGNSATVV